MTKQENLTERTEKSIDTGFWIDEDLMIIKGPNDKGKYWIGNGRIWGPKNSGEYRVDAKGQINFNSEPTGFYIENNKIFGPSKELPWKK